MRAMPTRFAPFALLIVLSAGTSACGPSEATGSASGSGSAAREEAATSGPSDPSSPGEEAADARDEEGAEEDPGGLQAACYRGDTEACDQLGH